MRDEMKWDVDLKSLECPCFAKLQSRFKAAEQQMKSRTAHHELYGLLAKNKSIHEWNVKKGKTKQFSEGSTQYILRKTLSDTIQRLPDGEIETNYDKATWESIIINHLFEHEIMYEYRDGIDMMSNLTNTFKMAFIYAFAPVRTGFDRDAHGETYVTYNLEQWSDVFINPDCKDIRNPTVVYFRQYMTEDDVRGLLTEDGEVRDPSYERDTLRYIVDHKLWTAKAWESEPLADKLKGATSTRSIELITEYRKGDSEFVTYVPAIKAKFRTVKNWDPDKGIPWNFFVLETDPDFPIGLSQVEFLLADQQFNDLFQTSAYKNLLLAMEPPIMVSGWETNPSSYQFKPRKIWNIGNNPNNKVEPVKIDNAVLSGWAQTREAISASMMRNLNAMDGTIAKDSGVSYSKTAPGVEAQQEQKTLNINQYQKRLEYFVSNWANQALRMYINAMGGVQEISINEETRRRLFDIGESSMLKDDNKALVDFDELSPDMLKFTVRTGSLIQTKEDQELEALTRMVQPFIQNLNGWSDDNRRLIENEVLLPASKRMLELSNTDISQTMADSLSSQIAKNMLHEMEAQIDGLAQQNMGQQEQLDALAQMATQQVPQQEQQVQEAQMPVPNPLQSEPGGVDATAGGGELSPSIPTFGEESLPVDQEEIPAQQVISEDELLSL